MMDLADLVTGERVFECEEDVMQSLLDIAHEQGIDVPDTSIYPVVCPCFIYQYIVSFDYMLARDDLVLKHAFKKVLKRVFISF